MAKDKVVFMLHAFHNHENAGKTLCFKLKTLNKVHYDDTNDYSIQCLYLMSLVQFL
jgi:hypothetical protein